MFDKVFCHGEEVTMNYDSMLDFTREKNVKSSLSIMLDSLGESLFGEDATEPKVRHSRDREIIEKYKYNFLY